MEVVYLAYAHMCLCKASNGLVDSYRKRPSAAQVQELDELIQPHPVCISGPMPGKIPLMEDNERKHPLLYLHWADNLDIR